MNNISKTIGWAQRSWNPITGCRGGCFYCYARRIYKRFHRSFEPEFHPGRLDEPLKLKNPSRIFVCSVSDFWGKGVKPEWRRAVLGVIKRCPQHTFFILTKQPQRIKDMRHIPENCWVGVSVSENKDWWRIPKLLFRFTLRTFISIEPFIERRDKSTSYFLIAGWIIVGAMTGAGSKKYQPNPKAVQYIIDETRRLDIPLFLKDNLRWHEKVQEFPR